MTAAATTPTPATTATAAARQKARWPTRRLPALQRSRHIKKVSRSPTTTMSIKVTVVVVTSANVSWPPLWWLLTNPTVQMPNRLSGSFRPPAFLPVCLSAYLPTCQPNGLFTKSTASATLFFFAVGLPFFCFCFCSRFSCLFQSFLFSC